MNDVVNIPNPREATSVATSNGLFPLRNSERILTA